MTSLLDSPAGRFTVLHAVPHGDRVGGCERQAFLLASHQARSAGRVQPLMLTHQSQDAAAPPDSPAGLPIHRLARGLRRYHPGAWWRNHRDGISLVHAHAVHKLCGQVVALATRDGVPSLVKVATPEDIELFAEPHRWREFTEAEHDPVHYGPRWRWMAALTWGRLLRANAFLALNDDIAARLASRGLPVERIRNAVDGAHFRPDPDARRAARAALGLPDDAPCLASVGRLVARKDLPCILRALAALKARRASGAEGARAAFAGPVGAHAGLAGAHAWHAGARTLHAGPVTLLVCGEGPQAAALARLAEELGVAGHVRWLGPTADVRIALHAADIFIHASRSEGFPNALLEALACGLPAVLSDIAGHRDAEALSDDAALWFPPGDADALAAALHRLLDDPAALTARGAAARAAALRHHDVSIIAPQWEQLYARHAAARRERGARRTPRTPSPPDSPD